MLAGIAVAYSTLPVELIARHNLERRRVERGGEPELQFLLWDRERVLPAWLDGRLQVLRWGNRRGQSPGLPVAAWTRQETVEAGGWGERRPEPVVIPAALGLDGGTWYQVREGVRGVAVADERGRPVVFVLVEPASHYYQVMTRSAWAPVLVGERI